MTTYKPKYINAGGRLIDFTLPRVMGILNITPDSFYASSRFTTDNEIVEAARRMADDGADFLDIGGYSSRPGADDVPAEEERLRVIHAVRLIRKELPDAIISVDTFRAEIAREAVIGYGAHMINDISGGEPDPAMFGLVVELNVPYIMMHMLGKPKTMQINPVYDDIVADILKWFGERIYKLVSLGVKDIILDPGFGFGKTPGHNFELLRRLNDFSIADLPVMVGVSRKSMVWKTLNISPEEALNGTTVLNTIAMLNGADILRVHDVREAVQAVSLIKRLRGNQ